VEAVLVIFGGENGVDDDFVLGGLAYGFRTELVNGFFMGMGGFAVDPFEML